MSYPICGVCQYGICSLEIDYSKILQVYVVLVYIYVQFTQILESEFQ